MTKATSLKPLEYAEHLESTGNYLSFAGGLSFWNDTFWAELTPEQAERDALRWIAANTNAIASAAAAKTAVQTAVLWLPVLPPYQGDDIVIPASNGYVRFDGSKLFLSPPDKSLGINYQINCAYNPAAPKPSLFTRFLETVLPDEAVRGRVQEYVGYSLIHDARHQRAALWIGRGANGKGVLASVVQALHRKVAAIDLGKLGGFNLANLPGSSLIFCDEGPDGDVDERTFKGLVAGSKMPVQRKFRETLDIQVMGKWLILTNEIPAIEDSTEGFWRRLDIVPFDVEIPPSERDSLLANKVINHELDGVFLWAMEGLERVLARGDFDHIKPPAMRAMDVKARSLACCVRTWIDDREVRLGTDAGQTHRDKVYDDYRCWAKANGLAPRSSIKFWERMRNALRGLSEKRVTRAGKHQRCCNVLLS